MTMLRFLIAGGVAFVVNQALLVAFYEGTGLGLLAASVLALEASIVVRFAINDRWTFRTRCERSLWRRFCQSNLTSFGSPLIALACVNLLTPLLGISYVLANSIGIALGLAWNWAWSSRVVWREGQTAARISHNRPVST
jgi:putative flippase GtrA